MGLFHFTNYIRKTIAIALLMIVFTTTISYATIDIPAIVNNIYSNTTYMQNLYDAGEQLNPKLSNADVDEVIEKLVTDIMNLSKRDVDNHTITKANYVGKIKSHCANVTLASKLDDLLDIAYPTWFVDFATGNVPPDLDTMYHTLGHDVALQLDLLPTPTPKPTLKPSDVGGGGGGGTPSLPVVTPTPSPVATNIFNDLQSVEWATNAINTLAQAGVISKNDEKKFEPLNNVKREEFVKLMVVAFKLSNTDATSDFIDVDKSTWFYPYVSSMSMLNLVKGYSDKSFGAGQDITRQDIAVLLFRVMQHVGIPITPSEPVTFNDDSKISDYAKNSVYLMRQMGIIRGTPENMFEPTSFATRAEAVQMIYNAYEIYIAKK